MHLSVFQTNPHFNVCRLVGLPAVLGDYHFISEVLKPFPEFIIIQGDGELPLRGVALLTPRLELTLHRTEEMVDAVEGLPVALSGNGGHSVQELQGWIFVIAGFIRNRLKVPLC